MNRRVGLSVTLFLLVFALSACHKSAVQTAETSVQTPAEDASQANEQAASEKPKPPLKEYRETWREECAVEQAYLAAVSVLEDLGLRQSSGQSRTVTTRDPRTGRTITQQVPSGSGGRSDGLSAFLEAGTTAGIQYRINMLLVPPASTEITIFASSQNQPESILRSQSEYLRQKIAEAIQQGPVQEESVPYPKVMVFDSGTNGVYSSLIQWATKQGFKLNTSEGDQYYRSLSCTSASGIQFQFFIRLIESNKTKLEMNVSDYQNKEEFAVILQGLTEALENSNDSPSAAEEPVPYPESVIINSRIDPIATSIEDWIGRMGFGEKKMYGDQFVRTMTCKTASSIRFTFKMNLIDTNQTKLQIWIRDYDHREEFPMILQSLKELLEKLNNSATQSQEAKTS